MNGTTAELRERMAEVVETLAMRAPPVLAVLIGLVEDVLEALATTLRTERARTAPTAADATGDDAPLSRAPTAP